MDGTVATVSGIKHRRDRIPHGQAATGVRPPGRQALVPLRRARGSYRPATPAPQYAAAPVPPWLPSPAVLEADRSDKPPWIQSQSVPLAVMQTERDKMLRTLMSADDMVGKVFDELHTLEQRRDTLAIFLSDNGYAWGRARHPRQVEALHGVDPRAARDRGGRGTSSRDRSTPASQRTSTLRRRSWRPPGSRPRLRLGSASLCFSRERGNVSSRSFGETWRRGGPTGLEDITDPPRRLHRVLPGRRGLEPDLPRVLSDRPRRLWQLQNLLHDETIHNQQPRREPLE